jgi:2-dehydro-3-deoxyphosphogluconate aldolase/(4S)-4-hydroxy-2-oxoglutarate aldolase
MPVNPTITAITESRIIGIVRRGTTEQAVADVRRLIRLGLRAIEVSLSTPRAIEVIAAVSKSADPSLHLGIGTVLSADEVAMAKGAGASFIVSPVSKIEVVEAAKDAGLVGVIGAMTPTECVVARDHGADFLKLFPAEMWSLDAMRGLLAALPALRLVPTGGLTLESGRTWLDHGAVAVGLGSSLTRMTSDAALRRGVQALARPQADEETVVG